MIELPTVGPPKWPADLADRLAHAAQFELRADRLLANKANRSLFRDLRAVASRPPLELRVQTLDPAPDVQPLFEDLEVQALEVTLTRRAAKELEHAHGLARAVGAELQARFVFTPEQWFDFEDVAIECAELGVDLTLALASTDEAPPLARLDVFDLEFVKNFFSGYWHRFKRPDRPTSARQRGLRRNDASAARAARGPAGRHRGGRRDESRPARPAGPRPPLLAGSRTAGRLVQLHRRQTGIAARCARGSIP